MASLDPKFHEETLSIHQEHQELVAQLDQMDAALEQMACYAEVFTDLATANQAISRGKWMAEWLPRHYEHEETTVLETIARMSPELASFAREMKRQHSEMRVRLESLRDTIAHLGQTGDLEPSPTPPQVSCPQADKHNSTVRRYCCRTVVATAFRSCATGPSSALSRGCWAPYRHD